MFGACCFTSGLLAFCIVDYLFVNAEIIQMLISGLATRSAVQINSLPAALFGLCVQIEVYRF